MPLPPNIDPALFGEEPPWPPPTWQVPPVSDELGTQPMPTPAPPVVDDSSAMVTPPWLRLLPDLVNHPTGPSVLSDTGLPSGMTVLPDAVTGIQTSSGPLPDPHVQLLNEGPPSLSPAPPPPLLPPDAVTGGSLPGQFAAPPPLPAEYAAPPFDPSAKDPFAPYTDAEKYKIVEKMSPQELMQLEATQASRRRIEEETALHKAAEDNLAEIKRNAEARRIADERTQAKEDQIQAEATALANRGLDRKRWFKNANAVQIIGAAIGTLVGGALSKPGQPNQGVAFLANIIDRDIDDQKQEIENSRQGLQFRSAAVAREFSRHGDLHQAAETVRQASYQALIGEIKTRQQDFDKNGTQYVEYGKAVKAMEARAAAAQEESRRWNSDFNLKRAKAEIELRQQRETERNNRATTALGYARINEDKAQRKAAELARADEKVQKRADEQADRVRQFSISAPRPVLQLDDKGKPVVGPDGKPITMTQRFLNRDGKEWLLGDAESTRAMKDKIAAASEITDMIDEVMDIRNKVGGEIMPWSDAKQRLNLLQERMRLVRKSGTQGMSSDKDFEALGASIGAKDLTSFIEQEPGLKEARERTVSELNTQMRTHNYDGPPVTFANRYGQETQNTAAEDKTQSLLRSPDVSFDDAVRSEVAKRQISAGKEGYLDYANNPEDRALVDSATADVRARFNPSISSSQQDSIAALGVLAAGPADDKAASAAREDLQRIASEGKTAAIQQLARATLESALRSGIGTPEETSTATRTGAPPTPSGPTSSPAPIPDDLRLR